MFSEILPRGAGERVRDRALAPALW